MKNTKKLFRDIIIEGVLTGKLEDFNDYLIEKSIDGENHIEINTSEEEKERVLNALENIRLSRLELQKKLNSVNSISFIGDFFKSSIEYYDVDIKALLEKASIDFVTFGLIIKNKIDITKVNIKQFVILCKHFKLSLVDYIGLIKRTYELFQIDPAFTNVMARYKPGVNTVLKNNSMLNGFNELMLKANKKKPIKKRKENEDTNKIIQNFIEKFTLEFNGGSN